MESLSRWRFLSPTINDVCKFLRFFLQPPLCLHFNALKRNMSMSVHLVRKIRQFFKPRPSQCGCHFLMDPNPIPVMRLDHKARRPSTIRPLNLKQRAGSNGRFAEDPLALPNKRILKHLNVNLSYLPSPQHRMKFSCIHSVFEPTSVLHRGRPHCLNLPENSSNLGNTFLPSPVQGSPKECFPGLVNFVGYPICFYIIRSKINS